MLGLSWRDHVELDNSFLRPSDITFNKLNAFKALDKLGWKAKHSMPSIVAMAFARVAALAEYMKQSVAAGVSELETCY